MMALRGSLSRLRTLSVAARLLLILAVSLSGVLLTSAESIHAMRQQMLADRHLKAHDLTEIGQAVLNHFATEHAGSDGRQGKADAVAALSDIHFGGGNRFFLLDENGRPLLGQSAAPASGSGTELTFSKTFAPWNWVLGASLPVDDVIEVFHAEVVRSGVVSSLLLLAMGVIILLVVRGVVRDLARLAVTTQAVGGGDLSARVALAGPREFQAVGLAFNRMVERLQQAADERRAADRRLEESESHLRMALQMTNMTVFRQDSDLRYEWISDTGASPLPPAYVGLSDDTLWAGAEARRLMSLKRRALAMGETVRGEVRLTIDGAERYFAMVVQPMRGNDGSMGLLGAVADISESRGAEERMAFLSHHDGLTGLPNLSLTRGRGAQALSRAEARAEKAALLVVDLDHFKKINDALGHSHGDSLLSVMAGRLSQMVRPSDTVCRLGADAFVVVLTDMPDIETVARISAEISEHLSAPVALDGHELTVTSSIGVALYPDDAGDFDMLLKRADMAMSHAKQAGRNACLFFTPAMDSDLLRHVDTVQGLRRALEQDEFEVYYQPQLGIDGRRVLGAEALIRWNHPERGVVSPGEFIADAEESGLIVPIGEWVLAEAARQAAEWNRSGHPDLVVAVNMSALQFKRGGIEEMIKDVLDRIGLPASQLELELTESILVDDMEKITHTVHNLSDMGLRLSIDDFGTGYSSLSYLQNLAVDQLKIDQSFVRKMKDDQTTAIVRTIVQMAESLGMETIAEGVETEEVRAELQRLGCGSAQGYYFGRPMRATDFAKWLEARQLDKPESHAA